MGTRKSNNDPDAELGLQRERLDQLKTCEHELGVLQEIEAELEVEKISADVALKSATAKHDFGLDADHAAIIAEVLMRKRKIERAMASGGRSAPAQAIPAETEAAQLQAGTEALSDWLGAAESAARWRRPKVAYAFIGVASVATILAAVIVHVMLLVLMMPLALALGYLAFTERDADWIRLGAVRRFGQTRLPPPPAWEFNAVRSRLAELETTRAESETRSVESGDTDAIDPQAQDASELALAMELVKINDELGAALRTAGIDGTRIDGALGDWLQQIYSVRRIGADLAEASARRKALSQSSEEIRDAIFRFLALNDAAPPRGRADVASLDAGLQRFEERKKNF